MLAWRLSRFPKLDGAGGLYGAGRWNHMGHPIVYAAASAGTALVEVVVHLEVDPEDLPSDYRMLSIQIPDDLIASAEAVIEGDPILSDEMASRNFGTEWLQQKRSALLLVPSVIVPMEQNVLINPLHTEASRIVLKEERPYAFDKRLFK